MNITMPPGIAGNIVHKWELVKNLSELGHEVHTLSYGESKNIKLDNVYFHTIPKVNKIRIFKGLLYRFTCAMFLLKIITKHHFDILYTRSPALISGVIGYIAKKIFGLKLVFEIDAIIFEEQELERRELIRSKSSVLKSKISENILIEYRKYKEIFMWDKADAVIAVTNGIKRDLIRHGVDEAKIWVIGNGANTDLFRPLNQSIVKTELGLDDATKYVCFVGNLAPWQGVEYLIKSAPLILKELPNTNFLIVGDGMMKEKLVELVQKKGVSDKFIFTGTVPYEEVPKYINASDLCVHLPFGKRNENVGASSLKLFEYMACGKPVITSDVSGIPKEIERVNAGILISCNLQEIVNSIIKLLKKKKLREEMGKNCRKSVVENHSWEIVAEKVAEVCENVIKQRKYR